VSDGLGGTDEATVLITVLSEPLPLAPALEKSTSGDLRLSWDVLPGRYYRVLYAEDLSTMQWTVLAENLHSPDGTLDWTSPQFAGGRGYFRVEATTEAVASLLED
jgi:hypothetical protein